MQQQQAISHTQIWDNIKQDLRSHYGEEVYTEYISKLDFVSSTYNRVILHVASPEAKLKIQEDYLSLVSKLWNYYDNKIQVVEIGEGEVKTEVLSISSVNNRYNFDNFVVGYSNHIAYQAAKNISIDNKMQMLMLYGDVGLGKTHLMRSIQNEILKKEPQAKVLYLSAEQFMFNFIKYLRNKQIMLFKEYCRDVDILLIDDIHFMCGKDNTQEELLYTINYLLDNNKRIVVSGNQHPSKLANLDRRLSSRLSSYSVIDIQKPDLQLRISIIKSKIGNYIKYLDEGVIEYIATNIVNSIRELEGAVNKIMIYIDMFNLNVDKEQAHKLLIDMTTAPRAELNIETIQNKVAQRYNITINDITSNKRLKTISLPRQIAIYLSRELTPHSLLEIANKFKKKDHSTILHNIKKLQKLIAEDKFIREEIDLLRKMLENVY